MMLKKSISVLANHSGSFGESLWLVWRITLAPFYPPPYQIWLLKVERFRRHCPHKLTCNHIDPVGHRWEFGCTSLSVSEDTVVTGGTGNGQF